MKVFISWSGERSKAMANFLHGWLKSVLQATEPWVSTEDIPSGTMWMSHINETLSEVSVGIFCLTPENRESPFIHYEAGAVSTKLDKSRVMALVLFEHGLADISQPLASFNLSLPTNEGVLKLLKGINDLLPKPLPEQQLQKTFMAFWPDFEEHYNRIKVIGVSNEVVKKRDSDEILIEILNSVRGFDKRISKLEKPTIAKNEYNPEALREFIKNNSERTLSDLRSQGTANGLALTVLTRIKLKNDTTALDFYNEELQTQILKEVKALNLSPEQREAVLAEIKLLI